MFSLLLSILSGIADKSLAVLSLSSFSAALSSAFQLAEANLDSTLGIRLVSELLLSFSNILLFWWIFHFVGACGAWEPLKRDQNFQVQDDLEDVQTSPIEDERRTSFQGSIEESYSCFKTSRPNPSPHYVISMGPRSSALSFSQLSLIALLLLVIFGILNISWRITCIFQGKAGQALMRSSQVFALLILGTTAALLILGLIKHKPNSNDHSNSSSQTLVMMLALFGNLIGIGE